MTDKTRDRQGREWAKLSSLRHGDVVIADGGFTCMPAGQRTVYKGEDGCLYVSCRSGDHLLSGQADDGEHLVGIYPSPSGHLAPDNAVAHPTSAMSAGSSCTEAQDEVGVAIQWALKALREATTAITATRRSIHEVEKALAKAQAATKRGRLTQPTNSRRKK